MLNNYYVKYRHNSHNYVYISHNNYVNNYYVKYRYNYANNIDIIMLNIDIIMLRHNSQQNMKKKQFW